MGRLLLDSSSWYRAETISERLVQKPATVERYRAERRLAHWRARAPFDDQALMRRRLAADGLDEEAFLRLLGESPAPAGDGLSTSPPWIGALDRVLASATTPQEPFRVSKQLGQKPGDEFLTPFQPFLREGVARLERGLHGIACARRELPFDPETIVELLLPHVADRVIVLVSRTLVLELHVARVQGLIDGATAEARYASFVERLTHPRELRALLAEYPVLARAILGCIEQWVDASLAFLQHLCADRISIERALGIGSMGTLVGIREGLGDRHRGGRTVVATEFDTGLRVVFKPRSLAVDLHFQELVEWVNAQDALPRLRTPRTVSCGDHGWQEFLETAECVTEEQVERFYRRQGAYLALLHALEATDFHHENVIAVGEHPMLVDLETLFHPRVRDSDATGADDPATAALKRSVLRVGLLPHSRFGKPEAAGVDMSGLGGPRGELSPFKVPGWEDAGTDHMRFVRKHMELETSSNRAMLHGSDVDPWHYRKAIASGFEAMYRLLMRHSHPLLSTLSPINRFAADDVRVLVRDTRNYAALLYESFHPDVLRDALDRELHFDMLWLGARDQPSWVDQVIAAEKRDLHGGDVPIFTTRPESCDLWDSSGVRIQNFAARSGMESVRDRLVYLSASDLERQQWIVSASLAAPRMASAARLEPRAIANGTSEPVGRERLLACAGIVGRRLCAMASRDHGRTSWIGLSMLHNRDWVLRPMNLDLYAGIPGVALFFAYLGELLGEPHYVDLALSAWTTCREKLREQPDATSSVGMFEGLGGLVYTLTHLGVLLRMEDLLDEAESLTSRLPGLIEQDQDLDVVAGAAGCVAAVLALYRHRPSPKTLEVALRCGEHLLAHARPLGDGVVVPTPPRRARPLTGFSHGASGMGWALLELWAITRDERFGRAAEMSAIYERTLYSSTEGNWRDLRASAGDASSTGFECAWCHGAPGIGMARLRALEHLSDPILRAEAEQAVTTTIARGFGGNHSLCHGDLGNLELLVHAQEILHVPLSREIDDVSATVVDELERAEWLCGVPQGVETPGLMNGLAGMGYGLLRLAAPERVPSVLRLESPANA